MIDFEKLAAPFPPERTHWRVGRTNKDRTGGFALAYIDARDVMDRLDEVVGPMNWGDAYREVFGRIVCTLTIRDPDTKESIAKEDGAGDTDIEGEKGGLSDALKRAAVKFGIGRANYRIPAVWVETIPVRGKGAKIAPRETARLAQIVGELTENPSTVYAAEPEATPEAPPTEAQQESPRATLIQEMMKCMAKNGIEPGEDRKAYDIQVGKNLAALTADLGINTSNHIELSGHLETILERIRAWEP